MRVVEHVIMAAVVAGLSAPAMAQTRSAAAATTQTTTQTNQTNTSTAPNTIGGTTSHWIVSGFVGSNFGADAESASVDFGGQLAYLWRGLVGGEMLADFAPDFKINNAFLAENPNVNAYMWNAIAAVPIGAVGQFQPYVSGGIGVIGLRADVFDLAAAVPVGTTSIPTAEENQKRFGTNIGGGLMGFAGKIGFRGDIRYYRGTTNDSTTFTTGTELVAESLLSGLHFWRANGGVAFRW